MRILLPAFLLTIAPLCAAQPLSLETELVPSPLSAAASFGSAVAIEGDLAVVGAVNANRVYTFARAGGEWMEEAILSPAELDPGDSFGEYVEFDGQRMLVSARGDDSAEGDDVGAVYVYEVEGGVWTQQAKLVASDGSAGDLFGQDAKLDEDQAIVATQFGTAAYVFSYNGESWTEEAILTPDDPENAPFFGSAAAIEGDIALVGAPQATVEGTPNAGAIYVFTRSEGAWSQTAKLSVAGDGNTDRIGQDFDYEEGTLVTVGVGARASSYVFSFDGAEWSLQAELPPREDGPQFYFGAGDYVELSGDDVLIGAFPGAYLFTRAGETWSLTTEISTSDEDAEGFGWNLDLDGTQAIIGARNTNQFTGSAYVFTSPGVDAAPGPAPRPALAVSVHPNPTAQWAEVTYELDRPARVRLDVYDLLGRRLKSIADRTAPSGTHALRFTVGDLAQGLYLVRLRAGTQTATEKLLVQ